MNHHQDDSVSLSTTAKANGYNPPSTSTLVAISRHSLYFSYKCVPSMRRIGGQYGNLQWMVQKPKIHDEIEPFDKT